MSITPSGAMSDEARRALAENETRADHHNMAGEAANGTLSLANARSLRNAKGYVPRKWVETMAQFREELPILAAVMGHTHPGVDKQASFLVKYESLEGKLQYAVDQCSGEHFGPAHYAHHHCLLWQDWFKTQWSNQTDVLTPLPDLMEELHPLKLKKTAELWLPDVSDVPALVRLKNSTARQERGSPNTEGSDTNPQEQRRTNRRVTNSNRDRRLIGTSALASSIRQRSVEDAIAKATEAGKSIPESTRVGTVCQRCISHHAKGVCYNDCERKADHVILTQSEKDEFFGWCQAAYA